MAPSRAKTRIIFPFEIHSEPRTAWSTTPTVHFSISFRVFQHSYIPYILHLSCTIYLLRYLEYFELGLCLDLFIYVDTYVVTGLHMFHIVPLFSPWHVLSLISILCSNYKMKPYIELTLVSAPYCP